MAHPAPSRDLVALLGHEGWIGKAGLGLGSDPSSEHFGATRFEAEDVDRSWRFNTGDAHSSCLDTDTESLYNIAQVVDGHGDAVNMARRSYDPWYGDPVDPEWDRDPPPTNPDDPTRAQTDENMWNMLLNGLHRRALWPLLVLTLLVSLGACGDNDPEHGVDDMESMKAAVNAELRDMADTLTAAGITVERANGRVESGGMGGYASEDYSVSALLVADGEEGDQIEKATAALEQSGWSRAAGDLEAPEPWVQLQREDFRTTISWTKFGPRELWFSLDQDGEVEVPEDTPIVDRNNSEDVPLD